MKPVFVDRFSLKMIEDVDVQLKKSFDRAAANVL